MLNTYVLFRCLNYYVIQIFVTQRFAIQRLYKIQIQIFVKCIYKGTLRSYSDIACEMYSIISHIY